MSRYTQASATPLTAEAITEHWNDRARAFGTPHLRLRTITSLVASLPGGPGSLLDIGCGPATLGSMLPSGTDYFGGDIASDVMPMGNSPDHFAVADLNAGEEPFPTRRFDVVVVSGMFEYIRDPSAFVKLLARKVRPEGHLILTYMNRRNYRELRQRMLGRVYSYPDPHLNFIPIMQAVALLRANRFVIARTSMITSDYRVLPAAPVFWHYPLNIVARQFLFVCRVAPGD